MNVICVLRGNEIFQYHISSPLDNVMTIQRIYLPHLQENLWIFVAFCILIMIYHAGDCVHSLYFKWSTVKKNK